MTKEEYYQWAKEDLGLKHDAFIEYFWDLRPDSVKTVTLEQYRNSAQNNQVLVRLTQMLEEVWVKDNMQ